MAKATELKPEEITARSYADRLILGRMTELHEVVKISDLADSFKSEGLDLAAIRSLLASNPERFAYSERRWIPAARLEAEGRPLSEAIRVLVNRFGGPMPVALIASELTHSRGISPQDLDEKIHRLTAGDPLLFMTENHEIALVEWVFAIGDETKERAFALHALDEKDVNDLVKKLEKVNWRSPNGIEEALKITTPVSVKAFGAAAWSVLNSPTPHSPALYDWRAFNAKLLAIPGYVYGTDGTLTSDAEAKKWLSAAVKLSERITPLVEVDDVAPIEINASDVDKAVKKLVSGDTTVTATKLLEEFYEITPTVKTFPDDLANIMKALRSRSEIQWVGGDRFRKAGSVPDYVLETPEPFQYVPTTIVDEEGEFVDAELSEEGLSSTLRKLLTHPLATDVLDEDIMPAPKQLPESLRLVLKSIHRELGTFPLCQFPTGFISEEPAIQELVFIDPAGRELQVWANMKARLLFGLIDWFYEQPIESGAVFSVVKTPKPNVFEFTWLETTDPVVFMTSQRMEELRAIQEREAELSTLQILQEVMAHWPKGADFLTLLWEVNVVRRSSRNLVASLLSSYACFYQRSGSPVWHYDAKKNEQGFDKTKRKFVLKR